MKKLVLLLVITIVATTAVNAQNEADALRFSRIQYGGSARYWGLGGAYGAVGADFSSVSTNPAGMGLFKRSEISFTPSFANSKQSSTYFGTYAEDSKNSVMVGSIGAVLVMDNPDARTSSDWKTFQFGFGYNLLANFNSNYLIKGTNTQNSLLGQYVTWANGTAPIDLGIQGAYDTQLAYNANLLFRKDPNQNIYSADVLQPSAFPGIDQMKAISTKGYLGETVFAGSANYQDKVYFGLSVGILSLKYEESSTFTESDSGNKIPAYNSVKFVSFDKFDYSAIKGTGYNLKFGVIVRPVNWLRLGAAVHTPAFFSKLNYEYNTTIASYFNPTAGNNSVQDSPMFTQTIDLTTPLKLIGSAAIILGKSGLISVDYEMVDYTKSKFGPSSDFANVNQRIQDKYKNTSNIRVGGEYRFGQISFRGGFGLFGSPYALEVNDGKGTLGSFGIGYRTSDYFVDCAYTSYSMTEDYYLYGVSAANKTALKTTNNMFMVTCGLKF